MSCKKTVRHNQHIVNVTENKQKEDDEKEKRSQYNRRNRPKANIKVVSINYNERNKE